MSFFLHITIIHELSHVVMLVFSSEPTPTKFHGYRSLKNNPAGLNHEGHEVERGEAGDSIESIIAGGDVILLFEADQDIDNYDPDMVDVAVIGCDQMQRIGDSPHVSEIATGMWHHISALAFQAIPSRVAKMRMKISHNNDQSPPSSPGSSPPSEENSEMLIIDPDVVLASGTHQDEDSLRIARIVAAARKATGRNFVLAVPDSSGLGPGEKR
ncbi:hypothetical protein BDR04DRAFT_1085951 [Suillus decipiens]|nr:hypothetical protein BDR04DRAFT_1085951 [Suillus decipiens]